MGTSVVVGKHPKVKKKKKKRPSLRWQILIQIFIHIPEKASERICFGENGAICWSGHTTATTGADSTLSLLPFQPNEAKEDEDKGTKELSKEEVKARIQQYNSQVSEIGIKLVSF